MTLQEVALEGTKAELKKALRRLLYGIRQRCNNPNSRAYEHYGARGIQTMLTLQDLEFLWSRDKGIKLKRPSIDRIDNNSHYIVGNCRFIELSENSSKQGREFPSEPLVCDFCGQEFEQRRKWQKFCSAKCRADYWELRHPRVDATGKPDKTWQKRNARARIQIEINADTVLPDNKWIAKYGRPTKQ